MMMIPQMKIMRAVQCYSICNQTFYYILYVISSDNATGNVVVLELENVVLWGSLE